MLTMTAIATPDRQPMQAMADFMSVVSGFDVFVGFDGKSFSWFDGTIFHSIAR